MNLLETSQAHPPETTTAPSREEIAMGKSGGVAAPLAPASAAEIEFARQVFQFFDCQTALVVNWMSDQSLRVVPFQVDGVSAQPRNVDTRPRCPRLPFKDAAFDTVVSLGGLSEVKDAALSGWLREFYRVAAEAFWVVLATRPGRNRAWWEQHFFEAGFRKHPLAAKALSPAELERQEGQITLVFGKVPKPALAQYPLAVLARERNLHMDMSRETGARSDAHLARYQLAAVYAKDGDIILDGACGLGYGSALLARQFPQAKVIGVDDSEFAITYARQNFAAILPNLEFHRADVTDLKWLAGRQISYLVSFETIEHIVDPDRFLRLITEQMPPDARFIGSVPNMWVDETGKDPNPFHLDVYDLGKFSKLVSQHFKLAQIFRQNAENGAKGNHGRILRPFKAGQPTVEPEKDAEWWLLAGAGLVQPQSAKKLRSPGLVVKEAAQTPAAITLAANEAAASSRPAAPQPVEAKKNTAVLYDGKPPRIVVLDEPARFSELFGQVFEELGVSPESVNNQSSGEIIESRPDLILLSREWTPEWRLCAAAARRAGIPVVYVMDGVIEWSYVWNNLSYIRPNGTMLQPMLASDLCVIGQHPARILAALGLASRIHIVGLPRYDSFDRSRKVDATRRPRLVVATARTVGHNVEQQVFVRRALCDLKAWFEANPVADVVWRIAADLAEEMGIQCSVQGSLADALQDSAGLIAFPSTCVLEGMLKGLPVAQVEYRPVPVYVATAWEIRSPEHIPSVVHELLYPPANKLAYQDGCLADELESGSAAARLAGVIRNALLRHKQPEPPEPAQPARVYGRLDYRQIHSELSAFAMAGESQLQYELDAAYAVVKQIKQERVDHGRVILEVAEALAGSDLDGFQHYSFLDHFSDGILAAQPPGSASAAPLAHAGKSVRTLFLHPPAEITWRIPVAAPGKLHFAVSMHPDVWGNAGSGPCRFIVHVDGNCVCDATIDPVNDPADRRWFRFDVDIPESPAGEHVFVFKTQGVNSYDFRWALWRAPLFLWKAVDGKEPNDTRPSNLQMPEFCQPGRTVA